MCRLIILVSDDWATVCAEYAVPERDESEYDRLMNTTGNVVALFPKALRAAIF
jgi:hypothetical protein